MKYMIGYIGGLTAVIMWLAGIVIASGFWSTTFAVCFFPYSWYLVVEKVMLINGWV